MKILLLLVTTFYVSAQRITTIQLDGIQYFISRMNPYSPELNYFLAYQYCRSLGLQLVSFETREKADTMMQYLRNAGYAKYDFWTSGNNLGTDMFLWMSTGLPFNATFDYMIKPSGNRYADVPPGTEPQRVARESINSGNIESCVAMASPSLTWNALDCMLVKDFICEQTRCYYYNYGSIPVSATQGSRKPYISSGPMTTLRSTITSTMGTTKITTPALPNFDIFDRNEKDIKVTSDQELSEAITEASISTEKIYSYLYLDQTNNKKNPILKKLVSQNLENSSRPVHLPHITSLFTDSSINNGNVFAGLETHEIRSIVRASMPTRQELAKSELEQEVESTNNAFVDSYTIGPYDSINQDYQADQAELMISQQLQQKNFQNDADDDSSTILPDEEPSYRYNIKVRNNGKVLDPSLN